MRTFHRARRFAGTLSATRMTAAAVAAALAVSVLAACGAKDEPASGPSAGSASASSGSASGSASSGSSGSTSSGSAAGGSASGASASSGSASASASGSASGSAGSGAAAAGNVCTGKSGDRDPSKLVLALVPSGNAKKLVESVKPLTDALTKSLGIPVEGKVTQDYQAAVEAMGADQADIGFLPSLQMSQACDKYGAVPELQTERNGASSYAAEFFTNKPDKYCSDTPKPDKNGLLFCNNTASGQGPAGLDELPKIKGATFSFLQAASPAGYIFPAAALKKAGVDPATGVTPTTVTSNDASVLAVYNGDAEVGAAYWDARTVVMGDTPDVGKKVVVFALTDMIPNDGVSLNGTLTKAWQDKITKALLDYASTKAGVKTLESIYQISGLTKADPAALQKTADVAATLGLG